MASLTATCRASARIISSRAAARGFTTSARCMAAQNFVMPALSPTMTEGNIATWKVKDGEKFSAGDVLLEIETDKATMDVEAQEDGVMMKIMAQDGSKAVQVGARIAVLAEAGDDVSALELPPDEKVTQSAADASKKDQAASSSQTESNSAGSNQRGQNTTSEETHEQKYPLMPAVEHLVKQNSLSAEDVTKIKPTGPNGRLLKGDILAYLGSIGADVPAAVSSRFEKMSHLDLSNIKVAEKKVPAATTQAAAPRAPEVVDYEINIPISLAKVVEVQNKIKDTLGVFLPMSTFINRAAEFANDDLPLPNRQPTANELFDQVLGLDKVKAAKGSRGIYLPQISAIPPSSMFAPQPPTARKTDLIDELTPKSSKRSPAQASIATVPGLSSGANVFSLIVPKGEEQRAQVFLERCKLILEQEPGRLVL